MTDKEKQKKIHSHRDPVVCPGCGKVISEDADLGEVEYVRTKRKTDVFFHRACMDKVWNR